MPYVLLYIASVTRDKLVGGQFRAPIASPMLVEVWLDDSMQIFTTYACSHANDTAEAAEPEPKLTHQSSFNSRPDHSLAAPASNLVPCDSERQRHLQQALILQMDMQKKLHDQLAVCFHSTIIQSDVCPPQVLQQVSAGSWQVPIMYPSQSVPLSTRLHVCLAFGKPSSF